MKDGGLGVNSNYRYAAFISYAHSDEAVAKRIHNGLETYPLPKDMDASARGKLTPIFRDVTELTAHHSLTEKIRDAVKTSRFLIVLCSPAAKNSHWVNEEIKLFRKLHGEGAILAAIVDGDPEIAFPAALTEDGREPLAANMTTREGFRFGITQLAASMLGVGLDRLVKRDSQRRRKRLQFITAGALAFAGLMGAMTWTAMDARDAAETSRSEAENMVEYMLTDLKGELDKVGRLSILNAVGDRVTDYYDAIPLSDMDDDRLVRQARARHLLGQVALSQGNSQKANEEFNGAYKVTGEIYRRAPDDPDTIFAHSQSEYWVSKAYIEAEQYEKALPHRLAYDNFSEALYKIDPNNRLWILERGWAKDNLGTNYYKIGSYREASKYYLEAIEIFTEQLDLYPDDEEYLYEVTSSRRNLAIVQSAEGKIEEAIENYRAQIQSLKRLVKKYPQNSLYFKELVGAQWWLQTTKIRQLNICDMTEINALITDFNSLIKLDNENDVWKSDLLRFKNMISDNCSN